MTSRTSSAAAIEATGVGRRVLAGAVGGVAGGLVFGMMMAMMGMLTMIASMMGSHSAWVGFGIHVMISIVYGIIFTLLAARWFTSWGKGLLAAVIYALILWLIGPLMIMPMMAHMPLFAFTGTTMLSLMGHIIYALILAAIAIPISRRRA